MSVSTFVADNPYPSVSVLLFLLFRSIDWCDDGTSVSFSRSDVSSRHRWHAGTALRGGRVR